MAVVFRGAAAALHVPGVAVTLMPASLAGNAGLSRTPAIERNVVRFAGRDLSESYADGPLGIDQRFTVQRPTGHDARSIAIAIRIRGSLRPVIRDGSVMFVNRAGVPALTYGAPVATDATGRQLHASVAVRRRSLVLRVDRDGARFPLTIDPMIAEANGISPHDEVGDGEFGDSIALSSDGSIALVGGSYDAYGVGAAWVFTRSGSVWSQQGPKLTADDEEGYGDFGISVALSTDGTTALIGGSNDDVGHGAAWIFTSSSGTWTQDGGKLLPPDATPQLHFGAGVALSGTGETALIGAPWDGGGNNGLPGAGSAWVFTESGAIWSAATELQPDDGQSDAAFGTTVALSADGQSAIIGSAMQQTSDQQGGVWFFTDSGSSWTQAQPRVATGDDGGVLSADGGTALVDTGGANATVLPRTGATWGTTGAALDPADASQPEQTTIGHPVALSADGNTAVTVGGAYLDGAAWMWQRSNGTWSEDSSEMRPGELTSDWGSGLALSADGSTVAVGGVVQNATPTGSLWIYGESPLTVDSVSPAVGSTAGGTQVTITGVDFTGATGVEFGGVPSPAFTVVSSSEILATSPLDGHGWVDLQVTIPQGTSEPVSGDRFVYTTETAPTAPTAVYATAEDGAASVSFTAGTGPNPVSSYTVTASPGGDQASGPQSPITVSGLTDGTPYTFTVTATNAVGPSPPSSPSSPVTPEPPPAWLAAPSISNPAPQIGDALTASPGIWSYDPAGYDYQWLRCAPGGSCIAIPGETSATYLVAAADAGLQLAVQVTAVSPSGNSSPALSTRTAMIPSPSGAPSSPTPPSPAPAAPATASEPASVGTATVPTLTDIRQSTGSWIEGSKLPRLGTAGATGGTSFTFVLSEPATVTFAFALELAGRRSHGHCATVRADSTAKPDCEVAVAAGRISLAARSGTNVLHFDGRISKSRRLRPGNYVVAVAASSAGRALDGSTRLRFRIRLG
ncbi:MAG: IPT/TIG domain-containing protein [Solirubrobacteraceae bacterium]